MAGESFQQLLDLGSRGKRTSVESVSLNQSISEARGLEEVSKRNQKVREHEQVINEQIKKDMEQRQALRAAYGTDDIKKVAAIKALGGFDQNALTQDMAIDPEGTRLRVDRMMALAGRGGVQDAPDGPPSDNERYYYRKNPETGTLEFTNIAQNAPADQGFRRYNAGDVHKDVGTPGGDVGRISAGAMQAGVEDKPIEDTLFEGKLEQARSVVERPERKLKEAQDQEKYFQEVWDDAPDIHTARERIKDDLVSGAAQKRGLSLQAMKMIDAAITKRGRNWEEMRKPGIDKTMFKPWIAATKPGKEADIAAPATVLNPGGGTSETTKAQQSNLMATSEANASLQETLPKERTKMIDYAQGRTPTNRGGRGKGVMEDVGAFLEGEGRHGYGESGPVGLMKDAAAFYGPRLPGDILSALGGVGAKRLAARGGRELMKIRAIENMFGKF